MIFDISHSEKETLRLTPTQQDIWSLLEKKDTEKYSLSDWYLGVIYAMRNTHNPDRFPQAAQSLREILEKLPRVVLGIDMGAIRLSGQRLTRRELMQDTLKKIDPLADRLGVEISRRRLGEAHEIRKYFENIVHHNHSTDEKTFNAHVEKFEQIIFDLLAPVTAQDQQEIQAILDLPFQSKNDIERMFSLIERRGANYIFFFRKASNPSWITALYERSYFSNPIRIKELDENLVSFPYWEPIGYLKRVATSNPQLVVNTILGIGNTDNPKILHGISEIALMVTPIEQSLKLKMYVFQYIDSPYPFLQSIIIPKIIDRWSAMPNNKLDHVLTIIKKIVAFQPDPKADEKRDLHKKNPEDGWPTMLTPTPRLEDYSYQEILNKNIRSLAEHHPFQIAHILINAVAAMIRLQKHEDEINNEEDVSEVWCRRLSEPDSDYPDAEEVLVQTLTFSCEKVFEKSPTSIVKLDTVLRKQRWKIFKRLRQHLYALYPNEQTKPWIREFILEYTDYAKYKYHYEFQQMIKSACEHFSGKLLTKKERTKIFDEIISGPSEKEFRDRLAEWDKPFTKDAFRERQRVFHRLQFRPFASVLFGKYSTDYRQLEKELDESVYDEDYSPVGKITGGRVSFRSPKPSEDLANLSDKELLDYINFWQNIHYEDEEGDSLIEINIQALAGEFGNMFKGSIIPEKSRLNFWLKNRAYIQRPVYVRAMVNAMQECVKENELNRIDLWLDFCKWVLTHPDQKHQDGTRFGDESRENPNWHTSRRAVGDFVEACLKEDVGTPISVRDKLADILRRLCTQFDWHLSEGELVARNDPLIDAINTIRGRALESLVKFGFWVRRNSAKTEIPEISTILNIRFNQDAEYPLTPPEYAILGLHYCQIVNLDPKWAQAHKSNFFPQGSSSNWKAAFCAVVKYLGPHEQIFKDIKNEYIFALEHLVESISNSQEQDNPIDNEVVDRIGQHLFTYYLWNMYPQEEQENLLHLFYQKTRGNPELWGNLIHHVGRSLQQTGTHLDKELKDIIFKFFDWRVAAKEPQELRKFSLWLEAECLPAEWRLNALSKVLDITQTGNRGLFFQISALTKMIEIHPAKVLECFAKMTGKMSKNDHIYINIEKVKIILKTGFASSDKNTREHAKHAQENLLRNGYFEFMQLDE